MILGFCSLGETGTTFLSWSHLWLSGLEKYWYDDKTERGLVFNPLCSLNDSAHLHQLYRPAGLSEWKSFIQETSTIAEEDFVFKGNPDRALGNGFLATKEMRLNDLLCCMDYALNKKVKIVYLTFDHCFPTIIHRPHSPSIFGDLFVRNSYIKEMIKKKYNTSGLDAKLETFGKMRDFLTFNIKNLTISPQDAIKINIKQAVDPNFLSINYRDWINFPEKTMETFFSFLDKKIDKSRIDHWLLVHRQWKRFMLPQLNFFDHMDNIINCILAGENFSLKEYHLDVFGEAILQHELMKKFNRRLNTTNLDYFPDNTAKLSRYLK
jgi:hypothetical protein